MAARRPRHRRWLVRRRRFLDTQGGQVTDTWLHIPLLPRRILTWRSPDRWTWHVQYTPSVGSRVFLIVLLLVALVGDGFLDVGTGQWMARIPDYLVMLVGLGIQTVMTWRATHRPE